MSVGWVAIVVLSLGTLLWVPGCEDSQRAPAPGGGSGCTCEPDCPEGVCDLEVTLDGTTCDRAIRLVVAGEEVGELQPGETYRSCGHTWEIGQQVEYGVVPGTTPYFPAESRLCSEAVDHIRPTWRCSR